jgi:hypothetical protein
VLRLTGVQGLVQVGTTLLAVLFVIVSTLLNITCLEMKFFVCGLLSIQDCDDDLCATSVKA